LDKVLKKILIKTKKAIFSQKIGNNTSKLKGEGYDFIELREYEDGEDIRKIDWVISAKMQKPFVKVFLAQRELDINIVPILGGSVHFGTSRLKQEVIAEVCAILGYGSCAKGDTYSSFIANESLQLETKKTKKLISVDAMVKNIYSYNAIGKKVEYSIILNELFHKIRAKSIIFLIGDFFNIEDSNLKLLAKKHEVIAVIVRDKFEEHPSSMGSVHFTDPQTFQKYDGILNPSLIQEYEKNVHKNDKKLYENFKNSGIDFIKIYTDDTILIKMMQLFQ